MEALGLNLGYLLAFAASFGILFVVLRAWVYKPLMGVLAKRRESIARGLEDARVAAEARANAEKEAGHIIAEAQLKAAEVIREATERAEKVELEIRAQADKEVVHSREVAMAEIEGERDRMLSELRGQVVSLAIVAAQKLIGENLDEKRQRALVNEFFSGVHAGSVTVLQEAKLDGGKTVEVTSALPLTDDEQTTICQKIAEQIGLAASVSFRVDPCILGGLVVRAEDQVIDGSLVGRLEGLRTSLR